MIQSVRFSRRLLTSLRYENRIAGMQEYISRVKITSYPLGLFRFSKAIYDLLRRSFPPLAHFVFPRRSSSRWMQFLERRISNSVYLYPIPTGTWPVRAPLSFATPAPSRRPSANNHYTDLRVFIPKASRVDPAVLSTARTRATPSHYVSLGDFRRRVTRAKEKPSRDPLSRFLLASEENLEKWRGGRAARWQGCGREREKACARGCGRAKQF